MAAVESMNSDEEVVPALLCGLRKKTNKKRHQDKQKYKKAKKQSLIEDIVKLKAELEEQKNENRKLKAEAEEKNKQLIELFDYTAQRYNITECNNVIIGDNNTVIEENQSDIIEQLKIYIEQISTEIVESTKEHAQTTFQLHAMKRIVQETHSKVCCLSIDNSTIQNKLDTIENMLDVGRSQTWDELQLEKAIHSIKDWLKTRSSDARITYAMLPTEGKRLTERLVVMYGSCLHRFKAALGKCNDALYTGMTSHSEDICAECLVRWITRSDENTDERLYEIVTRLDQQLVEEQEKKIREKALKGRSYSSMDEMSQKSLLASNGNLCFEENYF